MTEVEREAATLRRLVERQDFAGVERSVATYVNLIEAEKSPEYLVQASELIEWARRNLLAARARIAEERDRFRGIAHYREPAAPAAHLLHIDA